MELGFLRALRRAAPTRIVMLILDGLGVLPATVVMPLAPAGRLEKHGA